jgi:hypothetical protein
MYWKQEKKGLPEREKVQKSWKKGGWNKEMLKQQGDAEKNWDPEVNPEMLRFRKTEILK